VTEQSGNPERPALRASDTDREQVAQILHNALSEGRISISELEERLAVVYAAKTLIELEPVTEDLPVNSPSAAVTAASSRSLAPDNRIGGHPGSPASLAIMSSVSRKGSWVVPRKHSSTAFWGNVELDLRSARFAEKHSTITAVAIMGEVQIVVPDDIIVEVNGVGLMGAFESKDQGKIASPPANAPVVAVNGLAFWGSVEVIRRPALEQ